MKKINEIIDYLNQDQKQTEVCEHEMPMNCGVGIGVVGISLHGEKPESGWFCSKCGEYVPDKQVFYPNQPEKQEEWREENIKELFAEWGLWSLVEDASDDGDGNLQLTHRGRMFVEELSKLLKNDNED